MTVSCSHAPSPASLLVLVALGLVTRLSIHSMCAIEIVLQLFNLSRMNQPN